MDVHINTISIDFLNNSGCIFCNMFITLAARVALGVA